MREKSWTVLTNHGQALVCLAEDPDIRLVDLAERIGVRERSAHRIVSELAEAGDVARERRGNRGVYKGDEGKPMRRPGLDHAPVEGLITLLTRSGNGNGR